MLARSGFADLLVSLAELGGAAPREKYLLQIYQWHKGRKGGGDDKTRRILDAWKRLVMAAIKSMSALNPRSSQQQELDLLLLDIVKNKAKATYYRTTTPHLDELFPLTLKSLQESGANINAPTLRRGETTLYQLFWYFSIISTDSIRWNGHGLLISSVTSRRLELVRPMLRCGSDPTKECAGENATPALHIFPQHVSPRRREFIRQVEGVLDEDLLGERTG